MKKNNKLKMVVIVAAVSLAGFGTYAFGDEEPGYGRHMRGYGGMGMGYGSEMMDMHRGGGMGYGPGMGRGPGMHSGYRGTEDGGYSDEELKSLDKEHNAFWKATEGLRNDVYQKGLELESELAKQAPDVDKARKIQEEILSLRGQVAQKRLDHVINLRKINPNVGRGFMGRGAMAFGSGASCGR
ncbi:MAG: hypothetical protein Q8P24_10040 [Desulfobacterales bacterium]|nr:hypothetical protein [Desulfobacterales bacterium]